MYELDPASSTPLYQQIIDQTRIAISTGIFKEGDKLPSIRDMAQMLLVNTSTVSKAYKDLEAMGFIKSKPGLGSFVALDESRIKLEKYNIQLELENIFRQALSHGFSHGDIVAIYEKVKSEVDVDA